MGKMTKGDFICQDNEGKYRPKRRGRRLVRNTGPRLRWHGVDEDGVDKPGPINNDN